MKRNQHQQIARGIPKGDATRYVLGHNMGASMDLGAPSLNEQPLSFREATVNWRQVFQFAVKRGRLFTLQ